MCATKMSESEPSDDASKQWNNDIRTRAVRQPWDEPGGWSRSWPGGVRRKGGMSVVRAFGRKHGNQSCRRPLVIEGTGVRRGLKTEGESTGCGALGRTAA